MIRLISILTFVTLAGLIGLMQTGASGALPSGPLPMAAPVYTATPSQAGTPTPAGTSTSAIESGPETMAAPRAGSRPASDGKPAAWQAMGRTADIDPLTEAGRWELFGRGVLNDVFFVDSSHGWAAGSGVWRTTDGGATWRRIPLLVGTAFYRIVFADRTRGWVLGHDNRILRTEDGGETWLPACGGFNDSSPFLLEYHAPNDVWSGGNSSRTEYYNWDYWGLWTHSADGGLTWAGDVLGSYIETLDFIDRARGWVAVQDPWVVSDNCNHGLAKTSDAGQTWTSICLPVTSWDVTVAAVGFGSATHGWLAAGATLWRSTDGGATWAEQRTFPGNLDWIQAENASRAWVLHGTSLWRTTDGGATWQLFTEAAPTRVSFRTAQEGWGTNGSSISKTTDGGRTWRTIFTLPAARSPEWFWDALTGWRSNGSNMERTADGGATWRSAATGLLGIEAFRFVDARNGWAWHNASLGLAHTTDGGATWGAQNTGSAALTDLQFVDARHGWVRNGEQVRGTVDGGQTWHEIPSPPMPPAPHPDAPPTHTDFTQLLFVDATRGWAAVSSHTHEPGGPYYYSGLAHTTDGGRSWGPLESAPVDRVTFLDRDHGFGWYLHPGWKCGTIWGISRSDDGGRTWVELQRGDTSSCIYVLPYDLYAADLERLWSPGMKPFLGCSSDGGLTWTDQRAEAPRYWGGAWLDRTGRGFTGTESGLLWYRAAEVTAYHAYRPPKIDGNLADWTGVPMYVLNAERAYRVLWSTPTPLDAGAALQAAWDANTLYFALHVYDDAVKVDSGAKPWQDDAVEIGLDGRHDHVRNYSLDDDRQFTVTALGKVYESGVLLSDVPVARVGTPNGYILEFAIPKARLGELGLTAQALAGLNWTLIDDDDGGNVESKLEWTGTETNAANASWGQLRLSALEAFFGAPATPTITPTPTITLTPTPYATPLGDPGNENWTTGFRGLGPTIDVNALVVDGDGNLYAGGQFTAANSGVANYIARWDGTRWNALGAGMNSLVFALALDAEDNLYAGGYFTTAGGIPADHIAKWNSATSSWSALGSGVNATVNALAADRSGNLYAVGPFTTAGGVPISYIAKWDGTTSSWSDLDSGMDGDVHALIVDRDGNLYAAGEFTTAGGAPANHIAKWDGSRWSALGSGLDANVNTLALDGDGNLYAGGSFTTAGGIPASRIAKWDITTSSWSDVGSGMDGYVSALAVDGGGNLYAGGVSTVGGAPANDIAKWNGFRWSTLGSGTNCWYLTSCRLVALAVDGSGNLYAGGHFRGAGGAASDGIARWTAADGRAISGPGEYTFYVDNLPVTIVVPPGGQGDLARINIQRFNKSHPNANTSLQTGYYWQIEGLNASGRTASGYSVDLTLPAPGFTPDGDDQVCRYSGPGVWDCAATSYAAGTITRKGVTQLSDWAVNKNTNTPTPTPTFTATLTITPTMTPTGTPTATPTATPTPAAGDIAGTAWLDADGDGTRAADEFGLVNVRIELVQDGKIIDAATTGGDGLYHFNGLPPGTYTVREVQPPWLRFSSTPDEVIVIVAAGDTLTIAFGDWNGRRTWLPLILR